jgi:2-oxo-4-hydroxy-4-carboxy-5-ureidoimidazoline decarboxylase
MIQAPLTLQAINALDQDSFVAALGSLFEKTPGIAAQAWHARPFESVEQLHQALCGVMENMPLDQKVALIQAHPDLAGKAAVAGELTRESTSEQASARLDRLSPEEFATFTRLNQAYRDTFGFPFVICVREHTKESILANFAARLHNAREQEIDTALGEIAKIAKLRLLDVVRV